MPDLPDFEKLGAFYLGKPYDLESGTLQDPYLLYDAKDLTTHAVCVGMTGSGKTGLCLTLLEEAAIDGIPAIAIDPKGDLGNLFLTFPDLAAADFSPWIEESAAVRRGLTRDQLATETARRWREGLASWGQGPERIERFRSAVDMAIYTPASTAGLPMTVLKSFSAPGPAVLQDADALRERISAAASGLLALLGLDVDPVRSREHILVSNILDDAWRKGQDLDLPLLIQSIQSPPFTKLGIFDLNAFYPAKDRFELAMMMNNLLASPTFSGWMEGEPLNIQNLLYTSSGRPRLSVISIAHLSESERMFFVTILLNEIVAWIRSQPGTTSLRAILYMDEIFGYFPPTANPPSKGPMLTLLKQARAYGLGVVLATQNPVDLDYKGLSNTGTWFLGRLQTERDKARVLEGLEGASVQAGTSFNRARMEATLAGLGSRVFLMNNVHEDEPIVFQTRWALSYLRGPLTRQQIETLMAPVKARRAESTAQNQQQRLQSASVTRTASSGPAEVSESASMARDRPPLVPAEITQRYVAADDGSGSESLLYRPVLQVSAQLRFAQTRYRIDDWLTRTHWIPVDAGSSAPEWDEADQVDPTQIRWSNEPAAAASFDELPAVLSDPRNFASWQKDWKNSLYRTATTGIFRCEVLREYSRLGESQAEFRIRLNQTAREVRDLEVEKLRRKYASKLVSLESRMRTAQERIAREKSQATRATTDSAISVGTSILRALFGRKLASSTNVTRAGTSMRSLGRASQQRGDVERAEAQLEQLKADAAELDAKLDEEVRGLEAKYMVDQLELEPIQLRPRKTDTVVEDFELVWLPFRTSSTGKLTPAFEFPGIDESPPA